MENKKTVQEKGKFYEAPAMVVNKVVIEQNILQALSGNTDSLKDMPGEYW